MLNDSGELEFITKYMGINAKYRQNLLGEPSTEVTGCAGDRQLHAVVNRGMNLGAFSEQSDSFVMAIKHRVPGLPVLRHFHFRLHILGIGHVVCHACMHSRATVSYR